jgi:hypothetical protein
VGIIIDNHLHARISVNGRISRIHDVSLQEVIAALEEAEGLISSSLDEGQGLLPKVRQQLFLEAPRGP